MPCKGRKEGNKVFFQALCCVSRPCSATWHSLSLFPSKSNTLLAACYKKTHTQAPNHQWT